MTKLLPPIALSLMLCACASTNVKGFSPAIEASQICPALPPLVFQPVDRKRKPMLNWVKEQLDQSSASTPTSSSTMPSKPTTTTTHS